MGYSPWGCKELDTTERLHFSFMLLSTHSLVTLKKLRYTFSCSKIYPPLVYSLIWTNSVMTSCPQSDRTSPSFSQPPTLCNQYLLHSQQSLCFLYIEGIISDLSTSMVPPAGHTRSLSLFYCWVILHCVTTGNGLLETLWVRFQTTTLKQVLKQSEPQIFWFPSV